jgi:hypothetical protein
MAANIRPLYDPQALFFSHFIEACFIFSTNARYQQHTK